MFEDLAAAAAAAEWFGFFDDSLPDAYWGDGHDLSIQSDGTGINGGGSGG